MKKIFMSIVAAMFTLFAIAADDSAIARLTLTGATSGGSCELILIENVAYTAGFDNGFDALCNINLDEALPKTLHMYSFIDDKPYSTIATNNLDNLIIGFISNLVDEEYTLSFEVFALASERTLALYDRVAKTTTNIANGESYAFSIDPSLVGHVAINDRFVINYTPVAIKGAGECIEQDVDLAIALDGKTATGSIEFTAEQKGQLYTFKVLRGEEWLSNAQAFTRANNSQVVNASEEDNMYFEIDKDGIYQFIWTYATQNLEIIFPTPTAVDNVEAGVQATKFVENGQIYIRRGNEVFNLQGQEVK